jgi:serine phosphatase RsbU (regulator of sigma subunit)
MVLYTDGITEASNRKGDEYGYDRLKDTIVPHVNDDPKTIQKRLIEDLYSFTGTEFIDDDYTTLIVKFKNEPESI